MSRALTVDETQTLSQLETRISSHRARNLLRSRYHDGEDVLRNMAASVPRAFDAFALPIGWPKKAVDVISSRCRTAGYSSTVQTSLLDDLRAAQVDSDADETVRQAVNAAVRYGVSFVFSMVGDVSAGQHAVVQYARSPLVASAIVDRATGLTECAVEHTGPAGRRLFLPGRVLTLSGAAGAWRVEEETPSTGRVLVTPFVNCPTVDRPMGQSRITPTLMGLTDMGVRTLHRSEVSAEFYAAPREALINAVPEAFEDADGNRRTGWEMVIGGTWGIPSWTDERGNRVEPKLEHIPQLSMQPFLDQFRLIAAAVSGETSIPMSYLGVVSDSNPTSAASIEASEVDLVRVAEETMAGMQQARRSLMVDTLTALWGDLDAAAMADIRGIHPRWRRARYVSMTEQSQFVQLQVQAGNLTAGVESTLRLLPLDPEDIDAAAAANRQARASSLLDRVLSPAAPAGTDDAGGRRPAPPDQAEE